MEGGGWNTKLVTEHPIFIRFLKGMLWSHGRLSEDQRLLIDRMSEDIEDSQVKWLKKP